MHLNAPWVEHLNLRERAFEEWDLEGGIWLVRVCVCVLECVCVCVCVYAHTRAPTCGAVVVSRVSLKANPDAGWFFFSCLFRSQGCTEQFTKTAHSSVFKATTDLMNTLWARTVGLMTGCVAVDEFQTD